MILSPHWEGIRQEFTWAFQDWHRKNYKEEVEIEWLDQGGTSECLRFLYAQYLRHPDGIDVDIFFGGGTDPYLELKNRGLLEPYNPGRDFLDRVPAELNGVPLYDWDYRWFGTHLSTFGILINKSVLRRMNLPTPRTWQDLADPKLWGWVGAGDPRASGTMHMMYELVVQAHGWEKGFNLLTRISGNVRRFDRHGGQVARDVALGEVACGLALDSYAWTQIDQVGKGKLDFVIPEGKTVVNADAIAILKGAPHLKLAEHFLEFVLSRQGQQLSMFPVGAPGGPREYLLYKMAIDPEIYQSPLSRVYFNPFAEGVKAGFQYDFQKGARRWELMNRILAALFIDPHLELKRAWKKFSKEELSAVDLTLFGEIPIQEAEALKMAEDAFKDPFFREKQAQLWMAFAKRKYTRYLKERS